ncbi:MAG: hypothetical protein JSW71_23905 [Gemmatimonadota bacterium]|nr:MAG: hypothetical protein JSW71_23905 [Gemmatimonadota bacterium]
MPRNCCNSTCQCNAIVVVFGLPVIVVAVAIYGLVKLVGGLNWSLPPAAWVPLSIVAALATLWGLWLGTRIHSRGEPLMLGVFGLVVAAAGFTLSAPLALVGVLIVLAAVLWSSMLYSAKQHES